MTRSCPPTDRLQAFLDAGLSPGDDLIITQHVESCPACQEALERMLAGDPGAALRPSREDGLPTERGELSWQGRSHSPGGSWGSLIRRLQRGTPSTSQDTVSLRHTRPDTDNSNQQLESPDPTCGLQIADWPRDAGLPQVPGYEMLREIGRGGMGVVYLARHQGLGRLAALKMLRAGDQAGPSELSRFRTEAEAVAALHHPHVVQIYDVGNHNGQPYLSLEYVPGGSLRDRLDGTPQPIQAAARLIETLARAMAHAHAQGVVHRDLKPANVLLCTRENPTPPPNPLPEAGRGSQTASAGPLLPSPLRGGVDFEPKITDFGLAKLLDAPTANTQSGAIVGTPSYMAPEQADARSREIGPATDVWALGAILYELLTGRSPFCAETPLTTLLQVLHTEPVPPSRLRPSVPRDLETICLKCLEKELRKRYASVAALAEDLRRFRAGEAITARPVSLGERVLKWTRRHPAVAALASAVLLTTWLALVLVTNQWLRANREWQRAEDEAGKEKAARLDADARKLQADRLSAWSLFDLAIHQCEKGDVDMGLLRLLRSLELAQQVGEADLERVARHNLASWADCYVRRRGVLQTSDWVPAVAISPNGRWIATGGKDRFARLWDARTCQLVGQAMQHAYPVWSVAFSPDSQLLLTASGADNKGAAQLWEVQSGKPCSRPLPHAGNVGVVAFHPDGEMFLSAGTDRAQVWKRSQTRQADGTTNVTAGWTFRHGGHGFTGAFSPDGRYVATGCIVPDQNPARPRGEARIWDLATGQQLGSPLVHEGPVTVVAFSPDSKLLLTGSIDKTARLWNVPSGQPASRPLAHLGPVIAGAFRPDGKRICTGGIALKTDPNRNRPALQGEARIWVTETGKPDGDVLSHPEPVRAVAFSPNGRIVLTGGEDSMVRFWMTASSTLVCPPQFQAGAVMQVAFSRDGRLAVTGSATDTGSAIVWEVPGGQEGEAIAHDGVPRCLAFSPDGSRLAIGCGGGKAYLWDAKTLLPARGRDGSPLGPLPHPNGVHVVAWRRDGQVLLTNSLANGLRLWEADTGRLLRSLDLAGSRGSLAWSEVDPNRVVVSFGKTAQVWDVGDDPPRPVGGPLLHGAGVAMVEFSHDGRKVLIGSRDRTLRLWDSATGQPLAPPRILGRPVEAVAWGADDQTVISGDQSGTVQVWDTTGKPHGPPMLHPAVVRKLATDPAGRTLVTVSNDRTVRLWDLATSKSLTPPWMHPRNVDAATFHPQQRKIATACEDHFTRLLAIPAPVRGEVHEVRAWVEKLTGRRMDAQGLIEELSEPRH